MEPRRLVTARTLRQFRASVPTRRKMASLRVSLQRRRLRKISPACTNEATGFTECTDKATLNGRTVGGGTSSNGHGRVKMRA